MTLGAPAAALLVAACAWVPALRASGIAFLSTGGFETVDGLGAPATWTLGTSARSTSTSPVHAWARSLQRIQLAALRSFLELS